MKKKVPLITNINEEEKFKLMREQLRLDLEKSRMILDLIVKREKLKRQLCTNLIQTIEEIQKSQKELTIKFVLPKNFLRRDGEINFDAFK